MAPTGHNLQPGDGALAGMYGRMVLIRKAEEQLSRDVKLGRTPGQVHLSDGQEAVAVGTCAHLRDADQIASTHRGHGHYLAKGGDLDAMFAEIHGKSEGVCGGMGGSMHVADFSRGIVGANGIVGAGLAISTGAALANRLDGSDRAAVCFFGDGAANQGTLMECLNISSLWRLPVLFVCENNGFSEFSPTDTVTSGTISDRARPFGLPVWNVDGNDVVDVWKAAAEALDHVRSGAGPAFVEARTYRYSGHFSAEAAILDAPYRGDDEIARWRGRDPIARARGLLLERGTDADALDAIEAEADALVAAAVAFAEAGTPPGAGSAAPLMRAGGRRLMPRMRLIEAVNRALGEEMARDPKTILIGEDVEASIFGDTRGLLDRFGPDRVRNTPISEQSLTGIAVGAAACGYRVILHMMFANFIYTGFDAIANQMAKLRLMSGGQVDLPVTVIANYGGGRSTAAQHSDTPFPALMNLAGVEVVAPSTPDNAKGLMKAAIRSDNPTFFLEPGGRGGDAGEVPEGDHVTPLGEARVLRPGRDLSLITMGSMTRMTLRAAGEMEDELGLSAEVLDLQSLVPLDEEAILATVARTGRAIVVEESRDTCSAASHVAAILADRGFADLKAPVRRITVPDAAMPYAPSAEQPLLPSPARIAAAAKAMFPGS